MHGWQPCLMSRGRDTASAFTSSSHQEVSAPGKRNLAELVFILVHLMGHLTHGWQPCLMSRDEALGKCACLDWALLQLSLFVL